MKKIRKLLIFIFTIVVLASISIGVSAVTFSGTSSSGYSSYKSSSGGGFSVPYSSSSTALLGYRISIVNNTTGTTKITANYYNSSTAETYKYFLVDKNDYNESQNKVELITTTNGSYTTMTASSSGTPFEAWSSLPDVDSIDDWANANYLTILTKLGYSESDLSSGDMLTIEPLYTVKVDNIACALTISDIAIIGSAFYGSMSTVPSSSGTSGSWEFISNATNMNFPNFLYMTSSDMTDSLGSTSTWWSAATKLTSRTSFSNLLNKGYGVIVGYFQSTVNTTNIWYNPNGGTLTSTTYDLYDGTIRRLSDKTRYFDTITYGTSDNPYNATTFGLTKTGYTFVGWNTKADGSGTFFDQNTDYSSTTYKSDLATTNGGYVTLYAQWEVNTTNIWYNPNGGTLTSTTYDLYDGTVRRLSDKTRYFCTITYGASDDPYNATTFGLTKTGYTFVGWNTKADGSGTFFDQDTDYSSTTYKSDLATTNGGYVTLYAQWEINTYTVTYNANGGTGAPSSGTKTYGVTYTLPTTEPTRTGYTFVGWQLSYNDTTVTGNTYGHTSSCTHNYTNTNYDLTFTAIWKANTYTVTYNANGGTSGSVTTQTKTYGVSMTISSSATPTRTGYTFQGWATSTTNATNGTVTYAAGGSYTSNSSTTLYAVWAESKYVDLNFYLDGTKLDSSQTIATADLYINGTLVASDATDYYTLKAIGSSYTVTDIKVADGYGVAYIVHAGEKTYSTSASGTTLTGSATSINIYITTTQYVDLNFYVDGVFQSSSQTIATADVYINNTLVASDATDYCVKKAGGSLYTVTDIKVADGYDVAYIIHAGEKTYSSSVTGTSLTDEKTQINIYIETITYTVTYNANGGTGAPSSQTKTYDIDLVLSPIEPTKEGYSFSGWGTYSSDTSAAYYAGDTYTKNSDSTLYAIWEELPTYTVTYDANGGTGEPANDTKTYGVSYYVSTTEPTKTGYTFVGWKLSAYTTIYGYTDSATSSYTNINQDLEFIAQWEANTYTVSYNSNTTDTVSSMPSSQTKIHDETLTLSSDIPTRTGYTFQGWSTSSGTSNTVNYETGDSYTTNASDILYAVWKVNTYIVSYSSNTTDTVSSMPTSQTKIYNVTLTLSDDIPTRTGYTFQGWSTSSGTSNTVNYETGDSYTTNASDILYAVWEVNTYIVSYSSNTTDTVSSMPTSQTKIYNVTLTLSDDIPIRTGYTFQGWSTSSGTSNTVNYETGDSYTTNASDILYAVWKANTYTVLFSGNGNTGGSTSSMTMTYDVSKSLTTNGFTKTGYTFTGWNTNINGTGDSYTNTQYVKNLTTGTSITLYAQWQANTYTVLFSGNGNTGGSTSSMTMTYDVSKSLTTNGFTKTGYTFTGWNT
ncbi:MAG: InlB B-repeat-containing protein, partial [Clostridia bacterium]